MMVKPRTWMNGVVPMRSTGVKKKTQRKNEIKDAMKLLYPDLKITLKTADALGILTWGINNVDKLELFLDKRH
jgi:hypothetical protein